MKKILLLLLLSILIISTLQLQTQLSSILVEDPYRAMDIYNDMISFHVVSNIKFYLIMEIGCWLICINSIIKEI